MSLILPSSELIKPATMSRRGFLRAIGIATMATSLPNVIVQKKEYTTGGKPFYYWTDEDKAPDVVCIAPFAPSNHSKIMMCGPSKLYINAGNNDWVFLGNIQDVKVSMEIKYDNQTQNDGTHEQLYTFCPRKLRNDHYRNRLGNGRDYPGLAKTNPISRTSGR